MGKMQSKHGDCIVVNAHFNPVCQLDDDLPRQKPQTQTFSCSELSLSLCDDESCKPGGQFEEEQCLHHEGSTGSTEKVTTPSLTEDEEWPEKAEEEKSEKEERGEVLGATDASCNKSNQGEERQEFSFTLYDFNGHGKVTKDDIASLVRSIYDALGKKSLPKSGSRTIKVRLAIGPDEDSCPAQTRPLSESSARSSVPTACTLLTDDPLPNRKAPESLSVPVHRKFPPQAENAGNRCKHSSGGVPPSPLGSRSRRVKPRVHPRHELLQWLKESTEKACYQSSAAEDNRRSQQATAARRAEAPSRPEAVPCPYQLLDRGHECGGAAASPQCERRQHRRSKSHEEEPPCRGWHHHYRHRERDLERQRAMRQVASWIEREQLAGPPPLPAQRHEHHHLHEHVHHHYHHYVD